MQKITIILIVVAVLITLGVIFLLSNISPYYFCTRTDMMHPIPTNYCKNVNGNLQYKDCLDRPENKDNIVGVKEYFPCKLFNKNSYFLDKKEVSKTKFFRRIHEVNQSCNGCVMTISPGID